ncbi:hypothetical protein ACFYN0_02955 [Streptomyces sp. NPDC006704]|uniref:hypothetical protein n=1 Tax=Streptomyces sp. NPDC006704 TaxID=3364760 RepID=UPI0036A6004E
MAVDVPILGPRWAVRGVALLLDGLTLRGAQRGEYLADRVAARVGSSEVAAALVDRLLIGASVTGALHTESVRARTKTGVAGPGATADDLWERIAERAATVPEREYERLRRLAAPRGHSVDSTHPPTHPRRHLITAGSPQTAAVVVDAQRSAAIATELAPPRTTAARAVLNGATVQGPPLSLSFNLSTRARSYG